MPLTKRQSEILGYLQRHINGEGYAPSFEEIAEQFGFQSLATVHEHLTNLEPRKLRERLLRKLPLIRQLGTHRDVDGWFAHFATCRAIAALRRAPEHHEAIDDNLGWLARDFGGIYHVILRGVNGETIERVRAAGADLLVAGSAIFWHDDPPAEYGRIASLVSEQART